MHLVFERRLGFVWDLVVVVCDTQCDGTNMCVIVRAHRGNLEALGALPLLFFPSTYYFHKYG